MGDKLYRDSCFFGKCYLLLGNKYLPTKKKIESYVPSPETGRLGDVRFDRCSYCWDRYPRRIMYSVQRFALGICNCGLANEPKIWYPMLAVYLCYNCVIINNVPLFINGTRRTTYFIQKSLGGYRKNTAVCVCASAKNWPFCTGISMTCSPLRSSLPLISSPYFPNFRGVHNICQAIMKSRKMEFGRECLSERFYSNDIASRSTHLSNLIFC